MLFRLTKPVLMSTRLLVRATSVESWRTRPMPTKTTATTRRIAPTMTIGEFKALAPEVLYPVTHNTRPMTASKIAAADGPSKTIQWSRAL